MSNVENTTPVIIIGNIDLIGTINFIIYFYMMLMAILMPSMPLFLHNTRNIHPYKMITFLTTLNIIFLFINYFYI